MNEEIDLLLSRYFSGEATREELLRLDEWLSQSEKNEEYFFSMTSLYRMMAPDHTGFAPDTEKALDDFKSYMDRQGKESRKRNVSKGFLFSAAAVLLLLIGLFTFYFSNRPDTTIRLAAETSEKQFILFDHVEVNLEPQSRIMYKSRIKNEVELSGKATFIVREPSHKGLIVHAGETRIQDIGTVFSVSVLPHEAPVSVEVEEGEVLFYTDQQQGIRIRAGERGVYDPGTKKFTHFENKTEQPGQETLPHEMVSPEPLQETEIEEDKITKNRPDVETENEKGEIIFDSVTLDEVVHTLSARYGASIAISEPALEKMLIHVSFAPHESIENILNIIGETLSLKVTVTNGTYFISK